MQVACAATGSGCVLPLQDVPNAQIETVYGRTWHEDKGRR